MERILHNEVVFHPQSGQDPDGRVFQWKGHLYRGITATNAAWFQQLFRNGTIRRLVDLGLFVETELTDYALDGYAMVVHHRSIPFVSYPTEWCAAMLRDAALITLDVVRELAAYGLTLKDAHPWNVLFDGARPVHVDLTSLMPLGDKGRWYAYDEFCWEFFYPLLLMAYGKERAAKWFIDPDREITRRDPWLLAPKAATLLQVQVMRSRCQGVLRRLRLHNRRGTPKHLLSQLRSMRATLENMALPCEHRHTAGRSDLGNTSLADAGILAMERVIVHKVLAELQPHSVLHIGSDDGCTPTLAARTGSRVVALNTQSFASTQLYHLAEEENLPILPLVMDVMQALPDGRLPKNRTVAATERLQCDLVLAPRGITRCPSTPRCLDCSRILDALTRFSRRWVVIGSVPCQRHENDVAFPGQSSQERLATCIGSIRSRFREVKVIPYEVGPGALLVCEQ